MRDAQRQTARAVADSFATIPISSEDRSYHGSHFAEVRKALFANPYQKVWGAPGEPPLPPAPPGLDE